MTFADLKNSVAYYLDDLQFGYFTETQVGTWLNAAQKRVQKRLLQAGENYYLRCVQTTLVYNQNDYVLPEDFKKLHRLEIVVSGTAPSETVNPVVPITLNQRDFIPIGNGMPCVYSFKRSRITIQPAPDSTYVMRMFYSYEIADMTLNTDEPDVPETYHELIALYAAEDGFLKDGRSPELLLKKIKEFETQLDQDAEERNQDVSRQIVVTGNFGDNGTGFFF